MSRFASYRLVLFPKVRKDGLQSVAVRVTYRRKSRYFFLNRACKPSEWDADACRFTKSFPDSKRENDMLRTYEQRAADALRDMERDGVPFSFDRVEQAVFSASQPGGDMRLVAWIRSIRDELASAGRYGNSRFYHYTANALERFRPNALLSDVDGAFVGRFERWMDSALSVNDGGKSMYLRTMRAACNRAIADKLMSRSWYPFDGYSLSHLKSRKAKKSAGLEFIRALEGVEPLLQSQRLARDLFLFSFYTRGTNLADIAELTLANIQSGRMVYVRKKTGRSYSVAISERAAEIMQKYSGGVLLFPVYADQVGDAPKFWRLRKVARAVNKDLRDISEWLGFDVQGLTFYTARHTYADSLKKSGVSVEVISQALGHADIRTTDAYLKSFGDDVLDAADRLLL